MSVVNGELKEVCAAKVRTLGEKGGTGLAPSCSSSRFLQGNLC